MRLAFRFALFAACVLLVLPLTAAPAQAGTRWSDLEGPFERASIQIHECAGCGPRVVDVFPDGAVWDRSGMKHCLTPDSLEAFGEAIARVDLRELDIAEPARWDGKPDPRLNESFPYVYVTVHRGGAGKSAGYWMNGEKAPPVAVDILRDELLRAIDTEIYDTQRRCAVAPDGA